MGSIAIQAAPSGENGRTADRWRLYECEFVNSLPDYLQTQCSICQLVLRSPHLTSCCGLNFCEGCIERIRKDSKPCPLCNSKKFSLMYNRAHDGALKQLEVCCTHCNLGCKWKGKLETLDTHLNIDPESTKKQFEGCAFVKVQCCHDGCGKSLQRRLIAKHQSRECPERPFTCEHCLSYEATYRDVSVNHWPECRSYPLSCPNKCMRNWIQRQNLEQHLNEDCPLHKVKCEFHYAGCETKVPRKDMPGHLKKNLVGHMTLLARQNQELTAEVQTLRYQVQEVVPAYPTAPVQIILTNFNRHMVANDQWFSEGFYTDPQGYKMCLSVIASGYGSGERTHVSCFSYLMRGDFDDNLSWPFRGDSTLQLLNQQKDNNHHTTIIKFLYRTLAKCSARVTSRERADGGWGNVLFISHSELGHDVATNRQYLLNDCLYFRVKVELK